ncbi:MAG TPA: hypothetical protein VHO71_00560 [Caproiciproducens sp.]|nr:hypothetical protein [Caproiciproducens sp.]
MKGSIIHNLQEYNNKLVWVEFENPDAVSCANCGVCGISDSEAALCSSGVYRLEGHFLVSPRQEEVRVHEYMPRIVAIYEWHE